VERAGTGAWLRTYHLVGATQARDAIEPGLAVQFVIDR